MKTQFNRKEQKELAIWAVICAKRVLPIFEKAYPNDDRPCKAISELQKWIRTGIFSMKTIRRASLSAHAAARRAKKNSTACFAARAAGQAVATAHVPEHAFGPSYYSLKIAALTSEDKVRKEFDWQLKQLPGHLRKRWAQWRANKLPKKFKLIIKKK